MEKYPQKYENGHLWDIFEIFAFFGGGGGQSRVEDFVIFGGFWTL